MVYYYLVRSAMGVSFISFLFTESDKLRAWSIISFTLFFILTVQNHFYLVRRPRKLEKILQELGSAINNRSLLDLKCSYAKLHDQYSKLSAKHKDKYRSSINEIREGIERKMRAGKKIEELLQNMPESNLKAKQQKYEQALEIYQRLPGEAQKEYYALIMQAKEGLERGS